MTLKRNLDGAAVLGARIDAVGWERCLDQIAGWASRRESRCVYLCNVHSIVTARRQPTFGTIINAADLAVPDGAPIAWRLRWLGFAEQQRISGPDLMWKCCARAAQEGLSVFLYGSSPETLERLRARLAREFPALRVAGWHAPPFRRLTSKEDAQVVRKIERSGAHLVFVALGCPKQEAWMKAHRGRINAVLIGVGAAFDFHAGMVRRAPRWMQRGGLEWLYRLACEPRRLWRRYLVTNTLFFAYLLSELIGRRPGRRSC